MNVQSAKVAAELKGLLNWQRSQILVSECNHFLLSNQESQFIFALVIQLGQLNTSDFGSDRGSKIFEMGALLEKVWERGIGVLAMLIMFKWLQGRVSRRKIYMSVYPAKPQGPSLDCRRRGLNRGSRDLLYTLLVIPYW